MEWLFDPALWIGLLTLILLEIVLGIDNLIFIAILTDKLSPHQRNKARLIGLSLAMLMRLVLLSLIFWLATLTKPLFSVGPFVFSGRDLILFFGGLFLLFKATMELHERLDGISPTHKGSKVYASFGLVIAQIVVLDAVFSLDSVITAVGMVDEIAIMVVAIVISIGVMLLASKPLARFVNAHQTVIVLCLSFLLMIGFSLVAEGMGFKIPKGYLYAAIGFSILIEFFNQLARRNLYKNESLISFRERTAEAILRMLESPASDRTDETRDTLNVKNETGFSAEERSIVRGALSLEKQTARSIMTSRSDIFWINLNDDINFIYRQLLKVPHSFLLVCRGSLDNLVGIAQSKDLIVNVIQDRKIDETSLTKPMMVHESSGVVDVMKIFKRSFEHLLVVVDDNETLKGLITPFDIFEAIAGDFPN